MSGISFMGDIMNSGHSSLPTIFNRKTILCFMLFFTMVCLCNCGGGSDGSDASVPASESASPADSNDADGSEEGNDDDGSDGSDDDGNSGDSGDASDQYQIIYDFYLKSSNSEAGDLFGHSVAISGDTAVIAARGEDSSATGVNGEQNDNNTGESGAVYVFRKDSDDVWQQEAYLKASNTGADDWFGWAVAVYGDTVVVGAYKEDSSATEIDGDQTDDNATGYNGAAYIFVRDTDGAWRQEAYLKASNSEPFDEFGYSVAIWGDTVAVGARWENGDGSSEDNNDCSYSGAVYVFTRDNGVWSQEAYLKASNPDNNDSFGSSVALYEDTLVVGAIKEDGDGSDDSNNDIIYSGAAYVFERENGVWSQTAYLKASNSGAGDWFGWSVAVSGDTIVVGADKESSNAIGVDGNGTNNSASYSGAAYVFVKEEGLWQQQAYLKASDTSSENYFGYSVSVDENWIVVGAPGKNNNTGRAYLFFRENGAWRQDAYFEAPDNDAGDFFGISVSMGGDAIAAGAKEEDSSATGIDGDATDNSADGSGAAYIF
jgi:hypothetical protein